MARKPQTEAEKKARAAQKLAEEAAPANIGTVLEAEDVSAAAQAPAEKSVTEERGTESGHILPGTDGALSAQAAQAAAEKTAAGAPLQSVDQDQIEKTGAAPTPEASEASNAPEPLNEDKAEIASLRAMIEQLQQQLAQKNQQPSIIQVLGDQEKVVMLFQAEVADDNLAVFGPNGMYGQVTGKTGKVIVPKGEWSRFYNESVRSMIRRRWLIVLSGMTDDERQLYDCSYREGELLEAGVFNRLLDMGWELTEIFPQLCRDHQEMVARRFVSAWMDGDKRAADRELIVKLNELSKQDGQKGLFTRIIEGMNAQDAG